jgi:hypothetical protein
VANVEAKSRVGARLCGWVLSCIQGHAALGSPTVAAPSKRRMPAPAPEPAPAPAPVPSAEATAAAAVEAQIGTTLQRMVSEAPSPLHASDLTLNAFGQCCRRFRWMC